MSRKPGTSAPGDTPAYSSGWIRPNRWPLACARRAISAAHSGATALVPPTTRGCPPEEICSPVTGSAFPATSGTPRPPVPDPDPEPEPEPPDPEPLAAAVPGSD